MASAARLDCWARTRWWTESLSRARTLFGQRKDLFTCKGAAVTAWTPALPMQKEFQVICPIQELPHALSFHHNKNLLSPLVSEVLGLVLQGGMEKNPSTTLRFPASCTAIRFHLLCLVCDRKKKHKCP